MTTQEISALTDIEPTVASHAGVREMTAPALIVGTILGVIFGASSLYLVLKVGLTVSASIPVAVISIALFRLLRCQSGSRSQRKYLRTASRLFVERKQSIRLWQISTLT